MQQDRQGEAPGLEAWLAVATRGLCDDARDRVRREISDHHASALEAATADGLTVRAAEDAALRSLGDPVEAGRDLRRTNLTRFQAALVREHRGRPSPWVLALHATVLAAGTGAVAAFAASPAHRIVGLVSLALATAAIAVMHRVAPRAYEGGRVRTAVLASALAQWLFYAAICVGVPLGTAAATGPYAALLYGAILLVLLTLYLPMIGKVRRLEAGPRSTR